LVDILTVLLISIPAGFIGSLTDLGGDGIIIPFLIFLGVPVKYTIAASMVTIIATSSGSAASYVKEKIANVKVAMYLEMFTIARAKWLELKGTYHDQKLGKDVDYKITNPLIGGAGMLGAGLAAGMLGIGAGAFKVSIHELVLRMPSKVSTATSNFIIGMTALAGVSIYFNSGLLYLDLAAPMAIGAMVGSIAGSRILNRLSNKSIRILFLVTVATLIVQMLYKGIVMP
jgi:uncharacterized membrane protein YfcA